MSVGTCRVGVWAGCGEGWQVMELCLPISAPCAHSACPNPLTGNLWHTATHAEHTRPMLAASGGAIQAALVHAFAGAPDARSAEPVLLSLVMVVRLAGLLGLDELAESCMAQLGAGEWYEYECGGRRVGLERSTA